MNESNDNGRSSRREFLRNAAVTAAAVATPAVAKSSVYSLAPARVLGANERIHIGHIGLGVQGAGAHLRLMNQAAETNNTKSIALSDLYVRRLSTEGGKYNIPEKMRFLEYRKLLDHKDVDAVVVATSDNWHATIAIDAMNAGKHVYCEKPMCKTLEEAFGIYDTVKKTKRTFQVGSQGCSNKVWHRAGELVREGKIGHVVVAQGSYMRNGRGGEWNTYGDDPFVAPEPGKQDHRKAGPTGKGDDYVDWNTFRRGKLTPEWDPDVFFRWRKYFAIGSGLVGDLFPHRLHPLFIAMGLPADTSMKGWPVRVSSGGGLYVQKINPETKKPDRDVPDFTNINVDFEDCSLMAMSSTINEQGWPNTVRGNKGTIYLDDTSVQIKPERTYADEVDDLHEQVSDGEHIETHEANWFDCIRTNKTPNCHIDLAARVQVMITLGELAYRNNQTFVFDPKTRMTTPDYHKFPPA